MTRREFFRRGATGITLVEMLIAMAITLVMMAAVVTIFANVSGSVQKLDSAVGDRVEAGALLASLDPSDFVLQVQEAEASLDRAEAEARNSAANYERTRALYENNNASRTDLDAAQRFSVEAYVPQYQQLVVRSERVPEAIVPPASPKQHDRGQLE